MHGADGTHFAPCVCTVGQVSSAHTLLAGVYELGTPCVKTTSYPPAASSTEYFVVSGSGTRVRYEKLSGTTEFHEDQYTLSNFA